MGIRMNPFNTSGTVWRWIEKCEASLIVYEEWQVSKMWRREYYYT